MPAGRPKTFDQQWIDDHVDQIPDMFSNGESLVEVAVALGMCKDTFHELRKEYPEFSVAVKKGIEKSEAWWSKLGRGGAAGAMKINPATWIFNMKNRFKWTDRVENTGAEGAPLFPQGLTIEVMKTKPNEDTDD